MEEKKPSRSALFTGLIILGLTLVISILSFFGIIIGVDNVRGFESEEEGEGETKSCVYKASSKGTLHIQYSYSKPWTWRGSGYDDDYTEPRDPPTLTLTVTGPDGNTLSTSSDNMAFFDEKVRVRKTGEYRITVENSDNYFNLMVFAIFTSDYSSASCCYLTCGLPILSILSITLIISGSIMYWKQKRILKD